MPHPHLIGRPPASTPADLAASSGRGRDIPNDLLREASIRLGIMSLMGAVLWVSGTVLDHLANRVMGHWGEGAGTLHFPDAISAAGIVSSLALFAYTRTTGRDPRFILDLGLGYMVFTAFLIGMIWHWEAVPREWTVQPMITWIGVVVLMFAAIVPSAPVKTLVAGLIAVSMNPIGMLIARARGSWEFGSSGNVLLMHYPDYMLAGVAVVVSHVVTRLGQQVTKAREMGSYQIGELLGRGGMGEVYRATHRMLARPAAIKLIRPEMIGGGDAQSAELAVKRFRREAEVAANLRSPHTVELYDFGVTEDQTLYFVMELLEGMNLETLVREHGPVPAARVIYILRQVCESLEEAHARGLVHRDIKPANIHIGRLGLQHDFVKVLDFGLVKSVTGPAGERSLATGTGITPGTPDYMAPEMALGDAVDGRADLYALGCVAYFLLTGLPIFEAANIFHMIARHMNDAPIPPSQRTTLAIPAGLERVVLSCVAKKREDRPGSAAALASALAALDVEHWGEEPAAAWWEEHRPPGGT